MTVYLSVVVEDELSAAVMRRLVAHASPALVIKRLLVKRGVGNIRAELDVYRKAAAVLPHVVVADLDNAKCAPTALQAWRLATRPADLLMRFAVRETEAWLLGDRAGIAALLGVPEHRVPAQPEQESDPKDCLLKLAARGRKQARNLLPERGSSCPIGPRYNETLSAFVASDWDVDAARAAVDSLARTCRRLHELAARRAQGG
ncbi:hypothetical protein [Derxia lacustris]|uniref:hypothetical protein n=1 Tax=Derxia lacustris TaxID=764842 RepID=UPI000A16F77D|nr:hypothetical protein [Derxia lacustris]